MKINEISGAVLDTALNIHKALGPGLLESVYQKILAYELREQGLHVVEEQPIPVVWKNVKIELGFRADLMVENVLLVELKSVEQLSPVHKKQVLTYLRAANLPLGLLINFGGKLLMDGFERIANGVHEH